MLEGREAEAAMTCISPIWLSHFVFQAAKSPF